MRAATMTATAALAAVLATPSFAVEYDIGEPRVLHGMEVAAVYLQPIEMEPAGMMRAAADSDIHLEADIHATADNRNGFVEGDWVPHLTVRYVLAREGDDAVLSGDLLPMVANDGPHYGDNIKLNGPGTYVLRFSVLPPGEDHGVHFGRHVDEETGVAPWFEPFTVEYEFVFAGTGKKGAY